MVNFESNVNSHDNNRGTVIKQRENTAIGKIRKLKLWTSLFLSTQTSFYNRIGHTGVSVHSFLMQILMQIL